jgi:hypothetical protein
MKRRQGRTRFKVANPIVIMYEDKDKIICVISPDKKYDLEAYGMIISDLVQNVALAFDVREHDVWK